MNNEKIEICNESNTPLHQFPGIDYEKYLHRTVDVIIMNSNNEILIAQRSHLKKNFPLKWCNTVAGHVREWEEMTSAANRETLEEIGIDVGYDFVFICTLVWHKSKHFSTYYLLQRDVDINELKVDKSEIAQLKWVTIDEYKKMCDNGEMSSVRYRFIAEWLEYYLEDTVN